MGIMRALWARKGCCWGAGNFSGPSAPAAREASDGAFVVVEDGNHTVTLGELSSGEQELSNDKQALSSGEQLSNGE